jgi:hypothetical protein
MQGGLKRRNHVTAFWDTSPADAGMEGGEERRGGNWDELVIGNGVEIKYDFRILRSRMLRDYCGVDVRARH